MNLSESEITELEKIGNKHPIVKQLLEDWLRINTDESLNFTISLNTIAKFLNEGVRDKNLKKKDEYTEAAIGLIEKSKPILEGLKAANILIKDNSIEPDKKSEKKKGTQII